MARPFLISLALSATTAFSPALAQEVTEFTLENGLQAVVIEDHRAPVAVQMLWYRVGSADEPPGSSGIAHYLEHLMFKATENVESGEFTAIVESHGGSDNAFTSFDYTAYHQRFSADLLGQMMQLEADRMRNLIITDEEIESERSVVLEERAQRVDSDPGSLLREQMRLLQYPTHPYRIPIIGWEHEIEQLDRDDVFAFYDRFYAPNNAVLVVAGDVTPEEVRALAEVHYGPLQPSPEIAERQRLIEPPMIADRRITLIDERVADPYLVRGYQAPERDAGEQRQAAALMLLSNLLSSGSTGVLASRLQIEEGRSLYVGAGYAPLNYDDSVFTLYNFPVPGVSLEEAEADLDRIIAEFLEEGVDSEQLERIKFQWIASEIYERDDLYSLADQYGRALTSGLTVADVEAWPEVIASITEEEIMQAAQTLFNETHHVTGYLLAPEE